MNLFRPVKEIQSDVVLRYFGFFSGLVVSLTALNWYFGRVGERWLAKNTEGVCWPGIKHCQNWHYFSPLGWNAIFVFFLFAGLFTGLSFLKKKLVPQAYWSLLFLNILKFSIIAIDYRLRLNQHIMCFWVLVVFLFLPKKKLCLALLIPLFYFWAGLLKVNPEWLSGSALYAKPWPIPETLIPMACMYVLLMEVLLVWGIYSQKIWLKWVTFAQLTLFHLMSFQVVGFFYPLLMFCFLSFFPLLWHFEPQFSVWNELKKQGLRQVPVMLASVFSGFQAYHFFLAGDTALSGEGRLFALHMFDALSECKSKATATLNSGKQNDLGLNFSSLAPRIRCDPAVYRQWADKQCESLSRMPGFKSLQIKLESKRKTDTNYTTIIESESYCELTKSVTSAEN